MFRMTRSQDITTLLLPHVQGRASYLLARRGEYYKYYIATYYTITTAESNDDISGQNRVSDNKQCLFAKKVKNVTDN